MSRRRPPTRESEDAVSHLDAVEGRVAQTPLENVVSHWSKLFEGFRTSSDDFYAAVERGLDARKIEGLDTKRITWSEGGLLSPDREYLRVSGDRHVFDICAAPFGTGFFFSSWVTKKQARFVFLQLLLYAGFAVMIWLAAQFVLNFLFQRSEQFHMFFLPFLVLTNPFVLIPIAALIVLWLIAVFARGGVHDPEAAILTVPLLGAFYQKVFAPETYYRLDTMLMFQAAVQSAMMEAIDAVTAEKGIRALTADERRPILHKLM